MVVRIRGTDRGESLIEILISIVIIGIAVTAILGAVGVAARASTQDERQIQAQALLRSWAEHIQAETTDANFGSCAAYTSGSPFWYTDPPPAGLDSLPAGFTPGVGTVGYWNGTDFGTTSCISGAVRRVPLTMTVPDGLYPGFTATHDVVVRRPCLTIGPSGC